MGFVACKSRYSNIYIALRERERCGPERVESMIVEHRTIGGIRFGSVDGIWVVREWPGDGSRE